MESSSGASSSTATAAVSPEERKGDKEMVHKTKVIHFLGRNTPIILQNDNGPCPLLAICNVLLLKNNLNLSPDFPEVSQEKLLSLVAGRLIDSNSDVNDKDAGYVDNQQQNIADAIDLLPRLTTGIDVNIKFQRIADFEFTPECAIFDLLDIPLYHGWIVDLQDYDTANAIGPKSYNTLMGELVALESQTMETESKQNSEGDCVDFAAATTATLGVPSPCLSRGRSFDESPLSLPDHRIERKGDIEEEAELLRVLKLSESKLPTSSADDALTDCTTPSTGPKGSAYIKMSESVALVGNLDGNDIDESQRSCLQDASTPGNCDTLTDGKSDSKVSETVVKEAICLSSKAEQGSSSVLTVCQEYKGHGTHKNVEKCDFNGLVNTDSVLLGSSWQDPLSAAENNVLISGENEHSQNQTTSASEMHDAENKQNGCETLDLSIPLIHASDSDPLSGRRSDRDESEGFISTVDGSEPIYEGEESILGAEAAVHQNREPMYEGEVILAEQGDRGCIEACDTNKDAISPKEGQLIWNFLKNSASQLTVYGLFCLQEGLKERELCVFFRNNHFNTMFKFEGELYILATDQGYISQPDLVWEKLNEVNGDTVYMTGNFKEFKVENQGGDTWDKQNAMVNTADYPASVDNSSPIDPNFSSDFQLAMALQQQEFEQQPPQRHNNMQQPPASGGSCLVTGPQVPRNRGKQASHSYKQETKSSKDKCSLM